MTRRFIVNDTFTSKETGFEYFQGAIYEIDPTTAPLVPQWIAEGKVRDPDEGKTVDDDEADEHEDDDEDDDDEPAPR